MAVVKIRVLPQDPLPEHVRTLTATPDRIEKSKAGTVTVTLAATFDDGYCLDYFTVEGAKIEGNTFRFDESVEAGVVVKKSYVPVTSVAVSPKSATVNMPSTVSLTATVKPDNATKKDVTWSSSDTSVATVDANGTVTGLKSGTVTITATGADGKGDTSSVAVLSEYDAAKAEIDKLVKDYETKAQAELDDYCKNVPEATRKKIEEYAGKSKYNMTGRYCMINWSNRVLSPSSTALTLGVTGLNWQIRGLDVGSAGLDVKTILINKLAAGKVCAPRGIFNNCVLENALAAKIRALLNIADADKIVIENIQGAVKTIHDKMQAGQ